MSLWRSDLKSSEITPERLYLARRRFLLLGAAGLASALLPAEAGEASGPSGPELPIARRSVIAGGEKPTPWEEVTSYNNFYEFGVDKGDPARFAGALRTRPWAISLEGEIAKPRIVDIDELLRWSPLEERIYRMRCVEGWSMVVPWVGFSLSDLIRRLNPTSRARYVAFQSLHDPVQLPGQKEQVLDWPYLEGLRMDEALNPLTMLAVGLYGRTLPNQSGAPLRLVVPWKYGFKGLKSIVRIRFTERQPPTSWNRKAPSEYGFYANVNPDVDHPRWSQADEQRLGETRRRKTLLFNGYGTQVAHLYSGMDLRKFY